MHKFAHMQTKEMDLIRLYEKGIRMKPRNYEVFKMFSPHAFVGAGGRDLDPKAGRHYNDKYSEKNVL
jgi:hypothetical protein